MPLMASEARKLRVALFGGSGTMGFEAFRELWKRRAELDLSLLLLPSPNEKKLFKPYEKLAGIRSIDGAGTVEREGLRIVWGDATNYNDVRQTVYGADVVLSSMALISPIADYYPELSYAVNAGAVKNIIRAIEEEPDGAERIRYVHTSTVAATGNRQPPLHWGRVGDPLKPSIFDFYALHKIEGERAVLESDIRHKAVLRLTFIMPTNFRALMKLSDPILFHMPLDCCMENITNEDAGFGLANCVNVPADSDFWGGVYNMGGGPGMRITSFEYNNLAMQFLGLDSVTQVTERKWFATRNFHMQYYLDSDRCEQYLHYQRHDLESYKAELIRQSPWWNRLNHWFLRKLPFTRKSFIRVVRGTLRRMVYDHHNGTQYWADHGNRPRMDAFYGGQARYEAISSWEDEPFAPENDPPHREISHGYDESKSVLTIKDLRDAARFRGGNCLSVGWSGDLHEKVEWGCARGHFFEAKPYTILKAGHWCPECLPTPWTPYAEAKVNSLFAQVWPYGEEPELLQEYSREDGDDISRADRIFAELRKKVKGKKS